ncbi:MAG: restriction endonuclease, partial [Bacteroidetes bacterium]|nr:restriction endonuclease [Bacteroidota bacterium]
MKFSCITVEGGLIPVDIFEKIVTGDIFGQNPADFGLDHTRNLLDEMASAFGDARAYWEAYQRALKRLDPNESTTSITREQWILPLLRVLGYHVTFFPKAAEVDGRSYAISHRADNDENAPPIHIEGNHVDIDKRSPSGRPRLSPHSLVQEYLNRTEHVWGIVSNGKVLRLLRDSTLIARPAYIEFDLEQMMIGQFFSEFTVFYRLVHRSRLPKTVDDAGECILERYYQQAIEAGGRVREHLRDGVEKALKIFGNGFLSFPANKQLRDKISSGKITALDFYRQLLRLVYRFLFLMVSEERNLVGPTDPEKRPIYFNYYSISRLRTLAERYLSSAVHYSDLWQSVLITFSLYSDEHIGNKLTIAPLNGDLFGPYAIPDLEISSLSNSELVLALRYLSLYVEDSTYRRINYSALDVEELGSVYESLLDFQPYISTNIDGRLQFDLIPGTERKSTGSYYTRPELVNELIKSALIPVMEQKTANLKSAEEKIHALLSLKICDPAAGSGHFLL